MKSDERTWAKPSASHTERLATSCRMMQHFGVKGSDDLLRLLSQTFEEQTMTWRGKTRLQRRFERPDQLRVGQRYRIPLHAARALRLRHDVRDVLAAQSISTEARHL